MHIDEKTVRKIAKLSRIQISDAEIPAQQEGLSKILTWVEQLGDVNTDNIAPLTSVHLTEMPIREDVVTDGDKARCILSNAPEKELNMFAVPKVVE